MMKLCIVVGSTVGGIAGSMIAGALGLDTFSLGGFMLGGVGCMVGVWAGWKLARKLSE